jgi:hypothetical protein
MAQVVTQLIVDASGAKQGVAEFEAAMAKAKAAAVDGGTATATAFERAQQKWTQSLGATDPIIRAQIAMEKDLARQRAVNADAVKLGIATQEAANAQLDRVRQKHEANIVALNGGTAAQKAFAAATSGVSGQLIALSAGAGPVGVFLSALGPWGLAASVGIGLVTSAFTHMKEEAARVGDKAIELRKFSEITGLSTEQIRGLNKAGAELGIGSEAIETALSRFTVGLEEAHKGTGDLYNKIREIDPALAKQLSETRTAAEGWDLYAKAVKAARDAGDVTQAAALGRAAGGRGGAQIVPVAAATAEAGGLDLIGAKYREISGATNEWTERLAKAKILNDELTKQNANLKANYYAVQALESANRLLAIEVEITKEFLKRGGGSNKYGDPTAVGVFGGVGGGTVPTEQVTAVGESEAGFSWIPGLTPQQKKQYSKNAESARMAGGNALARDAGFNDIGSPGPEAIESWKRYEKSIEDATQSQKQYQDALARSVNEEKTRQAALGSTVDQIEQLKLKQKELELAFARNEIKQPDFSRANDQLQQQIAYAKQLKDTYGTVTTAAAQQINSLQLAVNLANARTPAEQQNAQFLIDQASAYEKVKNWADATKIAEEQRVARIAQVNASLDQQLTSLRNEAEVLRGGSEVDQARIKAAQDYKKAVDAQGDSLKAAAVAAQTIANARTREDARDQAQADADAAQSAQQKATANQRAADAAAREADLVDRIITANREWARTHNFLPSFIPDSELQKKADGTFSQFNPKGYTSTTVLQQGTAPQGWTYVPNPLSMIGGVGSYTPTAQGVESLASGILQSGGSLQSAIQSVRGFVGSPDSSVSGSSSQLIGQLLGLLPQDQQAAAIKQEMSLTQQGPQNLATMGLMKQLNDQLAQLTRATQDNTSATQTVTDVLSPFYSQDPRSTHLGFRAFAGGGIMTPYGELPLHQYAQSGIATSPQVAIFGEGSTPEAYVPAPSGRIPVVIQQPANNNQPQTIIHAPVTITMTANVSRDEARKTGFQIAQEMKRRLA